MGRAAQAEETLRDHFALSLIDQKIREAETQQRAAKSQLAVLIQRQRTEQKLMDQLSTRLTDLTNRAGLALQAGREDLAESSCEAIAQMENERQLRTKTREQLDTQILRLRSAVEASHRTLLDLRQGNLRARALRREQDIRARLGGGLRHYNAAEDARALIEKVLSRDDPAETGQILDEIEQDLSQTTPATRLEDAGFGPKTRATAADVMARLRAQSTPTTS